MHVLVEHLGSLLAHGPGTPVCQRGLLATPLSAQARTCLCTEVGLGPAACSEPTVGWKCPSQTAGRSKQSPILDQSYTFMQQLLAPTSRGLAACCCPAASALRPGATGRSLCARTASLCVHNSI
jgi:hypothetical protein